ncbi:PqiC family protein [Dyella sp.]|uniref:PqiC family protein n=1 Tax=Dyella sp. TaxID=1869338 RepID=UPI002ED1AC07
MSRPGYRALVLGMSLALGACASAPLHYYTLVPPAGGYVPTATQAAVPAQPANFKFELLPVGIPAQVDQPQLVVRSGDQGMQMLDGERWIAPLADEVRGALSSDLSRTLHTQDVTGLPVGDQPVLRIKVDLRRFDSAPGSYALVDAAWSLHALKGNKTLACTTQVTTQVGAGYEALVQGHQQLLAQLADRIAGVAGPFAAGQPVGCPGS